MILNRLEKESELDSYDFLRWRPVLADKARLHEIDNDWSLDDLMDCLEMLDIQEALEEEARNKK